MQSAISMKGEVLELRNTAGAGPLSRLLRDKALSPVFQPIVGLREGSIYAHEALIRGPKGLPFHMPDALLAAARKEGLLLEFEIACVAAALETWAALRQPGRLFVNLSATALVEMIRGRSANAVVKSIQELGLQPRMLVIEITEHEHVTNLEALVAAVGELHAAGVTLALDAMGEKFGAVLDITLIYPDGTPNFWQFLQGRVPRVIVRARTLPVPSAHPSAGQSREVALRETCQQWVNQLWAEKDATIADVLSKNALQPIPDVR